jgi:hypothetical protein
MFNNFKRTTDHSVSYFVRGGRSQVSYTSLLFPRYLPFVFVIILHSLLLSASALRVMRVFLGHIDTAFLGFPVISVDQRRSASISVDQRRSASISVDQRLKVSV